MWKVISSNRLMSNRVPNLKTNQLELPWEEGVTVDGNLYGLMYTWGTIPLAYVPESLKGLNLKTV